MPVLFVLIITVLVNFSSCALAQERTTKIRGPRSTDVPPAPLTVGPLSPSDTLWRVAERIKPEGNISLYQVMYALYLKNPDAFLDNNLNHLRPGSVLVLPSLQEIQQIDLNTARDKSERDDKEWATRQKNAAARQTTAAPEKAAPSTDDAQKLQQELTRIDQQQRMELDSLRSQFADSMQQVEAIVAENLQLKTSLSKVEQELALIKSQLGEDSELQQQISQLLAQQSELLQAKAEQEAAAAEGVDWQQWFKNPIAWVLAACIPALLVLFSILLWVKKRSRQTEEVIHAATTEPMPDPSYQSPLPPLDDNNDLDESLFEIDDALLEDAFSAGPDLAEPDLSDELQEFDDTLSFEDDSLLPSDERPDKDAAPEPEDAFDPDNILSDTDLSALLAAEDDDDVVIELADEEDSIGLQVEAEQNVTAQDNTADADPFEDPVLPDEFDVDELIEEIDLDEPDEPAVTQEQQLSEALSDMALAEESQEVDDSNSAEVDVTDSSDTDVTDIESFDSSELEEFAESLVAESDDSTSTTNVEELDNSEEALLSAELAELLDQVQDTLPDNHQQAAAEIATDNNFNLDGDYGDVSSQDELLDVTESEEQDSALASLDLTTSDDASVSQPTDAALSVENPSKILDQYPQLELDADGPQDEESALSLPDDLEPELLLTDPDELTEEDLLTVEDETAAGTEPELDPMPDTQFDSLMTELEAMADNLDDAEPAENQANDAVISNAEHDDSFDFGDEDFVEIDSLLANAELQEQDPDRFAQLNVDVGLEDYADIIGEHERRDVDSEDNGYSAKLDLVRAYIEIDDRESADLLLDDILASDAPDNVKAEAQSLRQ